jgi:hypothetical protein
MKSFSFERRKVLHVISRRVLQLMNESSMQGGAFKYKPPQKPCSTDLYHRWVSQVSFLVVLLMEVRFEKTLLQQHNYERHITSHLLRTFLIALLGTLSSWVSRSNLCRNHNQDANPILVHKPAFKQWEKASQCATGFRLCGNCKKRKSDYSPSMQKEQKNPKNYIVDSIEVHLWHQHTKKEILPA